MKIKEILKTIVNYLEVNRQVGHTHTALHGVLNVEDAVLITHSMQFLPKGLHRTKAIPISQLENFSGYDFPLVFDNSALFDIAYTALSRIEVLEKQIEEQKDTVESVVPKKFKLQNINHELFHENYVSFAESIMNAGGNPFGTLKEYENFLISLSNNNIQITAKYETNISTEK